MKAINALASLARTDPSVASDVYPLLLPFTFTTSADVNEFNVTKAAINGLSARKLSGEFLSRLQGMTTDLRDCRHCCILMFIVIIKYVHCM